LITTNSVMTTKSAKMPMLASGLPMVSRIQLAVGEAHVHAGDDERGQELAETDEQADVDVAEHLDGHEVVGERPEQNVGGIPDEEERRHGKDEAAQAGPQFLELGARLHVQELLARMGGWAIGG
jgi:hypothetical protein